MSFFSKIKQFAGIGTVDIRVEAPMSFSTTDTHISGVVHLLAKSEQQVLSITVELREEFQTGRMEDKKEQHFVLGSQRFTEQFTMKEGDTKAVPFAFSFNFLKSNNDVLKEKGGLLGGLGKLGAFASNEKSTFKLRAVVDVKGTPLDPVGELDLKLVG